ncbi:hypothetical protein DERP_000115 [Dermatophagoides pteronyssinus]|uniref:Uncharacterized protein n=1 Tax=Dermatophagoides pteronyssinus TaxID=6956 RepID=A0ABQ8IZ92_DERPT|nr:hypothetical protein DERP_000115 [Dermatophagoides pteronyssinus]
MLIFYKEQHQTPFQDTAKTNKEGQFLLLYEISNMVDSPFPIEEAPVAFMIRLDQLSLPPPPPPPLRSE